jgi:bifunctional DNA-binding transcriptional regulator/antitoxin component of YhaV-PrlF toxin-antitoxin module
VFGGRKRKALRVRMNLDEASKVVITVKRRGKVVRRLKRKQLPAGKSVRKIRLGRKAKRGPYRVTLKATHRARASELTLFARYL